MPPTEHKAVSMGGRTPQRSQARAERAQRDAKIYRLALSGLTERQIAASVGLSPARVHAIVAEEIGHRVGPPAEEYVARRDAELAELWTRAYVTMTSADTPDTQLKALEAARRVNESRRKLRGADAPEALTVSLERRLADETEAVTVAVLAALRVLRVEGERRQYALEAAATVLRGDPEPEALPPVPSACTPYTEGGAMFIDGPGGIRYRVLAVERQPAPTVSRLALPPGPSATRAQQQDPVDAVLSVLADFEQEFGPLDSEEDGTAGTGSNDPESDGTDGTGAEGA